MKLEYIPYILQIPAQAQQICEFRTANIHTDYHCLLPILLQLAIWQCSSLEMVAS
jgi:hypothetical protein